MLTESMQGLLDWAAANPHWIGVLIFLVAFFESLALIGFVVPGAVLLFACGALLATGVYPIWDALLYATLGAILGDGLSYWLGRHYQRQLCAFWPLSRHPELLQRGEQFFQKHGGKSVALGRFVGPIRAVVPAVAGMLGMSPLRFYTINILSAVVWAPAYILPGVVFGASLSLAAEAAGRLVALLLLLVVLLLVSLWLLRWFYRLAAPWTEGHVSTLHSWLKQHPRAGVWLSGIIDPHLSAFKGLLLWGLLLLLCTGGFAWLLWVLQQGGALAVDHAVWQFLQGLRSPLMDSWVVAITRLGDGRVSVSLMVILGIWLWWRGPRAAVPYLFATLLFALSVPMLLKAGLQLPRPGDYGEGWSRYGFPSWHAAMAVLLYGFVALLVARELSAERRWLAYGVALLPIVLISFSRLYLGVHWLSDVLGGLALAGAWLTIVGIAYRRHVVVALKWRPMLLLLFVSGALLWALHLANSDDEYRYQPAPVANYSIQQWQQGVVSQQLNTLAELTGEGDRQLNLQWLGERASILQQLKADGWQEAAEPSWLVPLNWLLPPAEGTSPRVLPHYHAGQLDGIRALRFEQGRWQLLRLWSLAQVAGQPLWQGKVASVEYQALLGLLYLPRSGEVVLAEQLLGWWPDGILMNDELRLQSRGE